MAGSFAALLLAIGCAEVSVDDEAMMDEMNAGDGDGDSGMTTGGNTGAGTGGTVVVTTGGSTATGGSSTGGTLVGVGGSDTGGASTGGTSTGGTSTGGTSTGGTSTGGTSTGGTSTGGTTMGGDCDSPDVGAYSSATACGQTVVHNGSLYSCKTMYNQPGDCNATTGVWRCNEYQPDDATWGDDAWDLVMACP